jgi:transcriptional regulator with XRE-family HTH domain
LPDQDLPRSPRTGIAVIGDPRNDENHIVAQLHLAFMHLHDEVVDLVRSRGTPERPGLAKARRMVTWQRPWLVLQEFLDTLIGEADIAERTQEQGRKQCRFAKWPFMPIEYAVVAYRFGHSMGREVCSRNAMWAATGSTWGAWVGGTLVAEVVLVEPVAGGILVLMPLDEPHAGHAPGSSAAAAARAGRTAFGPLLRRWRQQRALSQLDLALQAEVSSRHLSWLETGRASPSRAMVLRLAEQLAVPLRERNSLLAAAGFAPLYAERALADPALARARQALQRLLDAHEPWPALAVDRHWNLVAHNRLVPALMSHAAPGLLAPPVNVLRLSLHPQGLAPRIANLGAWRGYVLERLRRQAATTLDPALQALLDELQAMPGPPAEADDALEAQGPADLAVPVSFDSTHGRLNFITTITVFGAPRDVTLSELAVETLLPADAATAEALRALHAALVAAPGLDLSPRMK